jgi:SAM-dependent methyltransferase
MNKTIKDFGEQWLKYRDNEGYYGSLELFEDILYPFLKPDDIKGCKIAEIGSGSGRIVNMILQAGARHVIALEPSQAFEILRTNVRQAEKVTFLNVSGEDLPAFGDLDYIFSIGVLHHIPNPRPVVEAAFKALRPGGKFLVWLYGKEGNRFYLSFTYPLRFLTRILPHFALVSLVWAIYFPFMVYVRSCHRFRLPLQEYVLTVFDKMSPEKRRLIIYDQLNPSYARYYRRFEAERLLLDAKFEDIRTHHRHGYSWTLMGTKS